VNSAYLETALAAATASPPVRSQGPLPCRALISGPFSPETLRQQLSSLAVPARSVALLTGRAGDLSPVDAAVVRWAHARAQALVGTLRAGDARVATYRPDVAALTGLGPGLTPTGDDLLIGMAAMARRLQSTGLVEPRAAHAFATALTGLASTPTTSTTSVALALLENASKGLYPSVLAGVVEVLGNAEAEPVTIEEQVALLSAVGAHSGADLLAGALALVLGVVFPKEAR
jgi:Protein of unknown function (DUF2877)